MTTPLTVHPGPPVEWLRLPATTVREDCPNCRGGRAFWAKSPPCGMCGGSGTRTITVPPVVPSFAAPCPECKGSGIGPDHVGYVTTCGYRKQFEKSGAIVLGWTCPEHLHDCPRVAYTDDGPCERCKGRGTVDRLGWGDRRWRRLPDGWWTSETNPSARMRWQSLVERGLAEGRTVISPVSDVLGVLEVMGADEWKSGPAVLANWFEGGTFCLVEGPFDGEYHATDISDEPWAANLAPGDKVIHFGPPRELEQPVTEMVCPECEGYGADLSRQDDDGRNPPCCYDSCDSGRVPLVLGDSFTTIEVEGL